jgi:hypothetical protein
VFLLKKYFSPEPAGQFQSNLKYKSSLRVRRIKKCSKKGQVLIKWKIITKIQKWGEVIEKFSPQEPLSQNSSDLHGSCLT